MAKINPKPKILIKPMYPDKEFTAIPDKTKPDVQPRPNCVPTPQSIPPITANHNLFLSVR